MPTYIQLLTLNQEGRRKVLDDPSSVLRAQAEIAVPGIQVLGLYGVLGNYDFVNIVEADDNDAIARFSLELGVSAGAHVTTLPAIPVGRLAQREGADELTLETEVSMPQPEEAPGELTPLRLGDLRLRFPFRPVCYTQSWVSCRQQRPSTGNMGNFTQPITLHSESGDDSIVVDALVDTGATFSGFPAPLLESLGIRPQRKVRLRLSNGRVEERNLGEVKAALNGEDSTIHCVFGDPESPAVIGAIILEAFLLAVDPVDQRLVPLGAYW